MNHLVLVISYFECKFSDLLTEKFVYYENFYRKKSWESSRAHVSVLRHCYDLGSNSRMYYEVRVTILAVLDTSSQGQSTESSVVNGFLRKLDVSYNNNVGIDCCFFLLPPNSFSEWRNSS